jgi:predicted transcriptional regulator
LDTARLKNPTSENKETNVESWRLFGMVKLNKVDEQVVAALKEGKELTLQELSEKTGVPSKKVFKSLRKLFENEMVDTKARKYKLC